MIEGEMLPVHNGTTTTMTGKSIKKFLKSKGADVSASVVSRMKQAIDEKLHGDVAESYQKLEAYFTLMIITPAEMNVWSRNYSKLAKIEQLQMECAKFTPLMEGTYSVQHLGPIAIPGYVHPHRILNDTRRLSNGHFRDSYGLPFLPCPITATLHQDLGVLTPRQETPPEKLENGGLTPKVV
ncbi:Hypothetical protein PHPALM_6178 [Phytophthora palmivora]|uniref:Uncharacterized protein n=1 Tax=Phytophthora palmivora TaxID=4796 RepID=A0A2P4YFH0_9STRA|nr:Hypothetical protein PHPALM_6178 [Phytophthora palmivora]